MDFVEFPTTMWSGIRAAGNENALEANEVSRRYRPAVVTFLRQKGYSLADSEDLTQNVFLRLFSEKVLARADEERGRFRGLIITITKQVMYDEHRKKSATKRGGNIKIISMEAPPDIEAVMEKDVEEEEFDRCWAANLITLAMDRLSEESEKTQKEYHKALTMRVEGKEYSAIAEALGTSVSTVSTWIQRARQRIKRYIEEEIRTYSSSSHEFKNDTTYMKKYISPEEE